MSDVEVLDELLAQINEAPHSAAALTLYALVSTLEFEQAGYLFKLAKLRDLTAPQRQVAYRLIELMADGNNTGPAWDAAKQKMDALVRAG
ncbi:MAG: hypothetical protein KDI82_06310 [Gammaproteobacteria bacterium]|nr:hypothetical protein [Gammaproteobacteria bacterium]